MAASGSNAIGGGGGGGGLAARLGSILEAISPTVAPPADDTAVLTATAPPLVIAQRNVLLTEPHNCTDSKDSLTILDALFDGLVQLEPATGAY